MNYFKIAQDITRTYEQAVGYRHCIGCDQKFIPAKDEPENGRFRDFCLHCCRVINVYLGMEARREAEIADAQTESLKYCRLGAEGSLWGCSRLAGHTGPCEDISF